MYIVISKEDLSGLIDGTCTDSMIVRLSPHQHTTTMAEVCYLLADDALKSGYNKYVYGGRGTFFGVMHGIYLK